MAQRCRHRTAAAGVAIALAALGGCAGGDDGDDGTTTREVTADEVAAAVSVEAVESRNLAADGNLGVAVTNTGDEPIDLGEVTLHAPPFPASSVTPRGPVEPGRTVRYGVPQEEPDCTTLEEFPDGVAPDDAYTVDLAVGAETVSVPAGRPEVYRRLGDRACGVVKVLAVAEVTFGPPVRDGSAGAGATVATTVELTRRPGMSGTLTVTGVRGTPQFTLTGAAEAPLATLGPSDETAVAAVTVGALRCDAHVLAEGKKNYTFGVFLSLDGGPDALLDLPAPDDLHAALVEVCDVH